MRAISRVGILSLAFLGLRALVGAPCARLELLFRPVVAVVVRRRGFASVVDRAEDWEWGVMFVKGGLDTAASRRVLGLFLHFRDRAGGEWRGL